MKNNLSLNIEQKLYDYLIRLRVNLENLEILYTIYIFKVTHMLNFMALCIQFGEMHRNIIN